MLSVHEKSVFVQFLDEILGSCDSEDGVGTVNHMVNFLGERRCLAAFFSVYFIPTDFLM